MQTLHQSIFIQAPREKVWDTMLSEETYSEWTKPFSPDSSSVGTYKGSWEKGSKIIFIGTDEDGGESGMVSFIAENKPYEFISIEHKGLYANGIEDTSSEEAAKWAPAYENYTFVSINGGTELSIDVQVADEYLQMFKDTWPKALQSLKVLSEK
jgi:hypothetical protein